MKKNGTKLYTAWLNMKARCTNENHRDYDLYGGSGITIYSPWQESFEEFCSGVGEPPSFEGRWTLERVNNDLGYSPGNTLWTSQTLQNRNRGMFRNNTSGVTGVYKVDVSGVIKWVAKWMDSEQKLRSKTFSTSRYGAQAFKLACEYRESQIQLLNSAGAGYTELHGSKL